jgi:hypothetical protein
MTDVLYEGWFELQVMGFLAALVAFLWLEGAEGNERLQAAAAEGRAAVLRVATLAFPTNGGRARLVRLALRLDRAEASSESSATDYRSAPSGTAGADPPEALALAYEAERRRLHVGGALGALGVFAMLAAMGAMLVTKEGYWAALASAPLALGLGYAVAARWRQTARALDDVVRALPGIVAEVEPPPAPAPTAPPGLVVDFSYRSGAFASAMAAIMVSVFSLIGALALFVALTSLTTRVSIGSAYPILLSHVFGGLPFLVLYSFDSHRVGIDAARRDLVVVRRRLLGTIRTRRVVPLELLRGFTTRVLPGGRGSTTYVVAEIGPGAAERVDLGDSDPVRATELAAELTTALLPTAPHGTSKKKHRAHR